MNAKRKPKYLIGQWVYNKQYDEVQRIRQLSQWPQVRVQEIGSTLVYDTHHNNLRPLTRRERGR